ncbi:hypothetical protein RhiJN_22832 [Ceratobasidium sp. AG-Ba]|nr:hypothetical protein RhiJN_22832 [Ceratobasidium sp. AG-Ba]
MAKGKNLNPADAHRKAQRAKELKKNKENRAKAREMATLKKDTGGLETEMQELEDLGESKLDSKQAARLKELRVEVERIRKVKQDYVKAHPEQAHLVRGLHGSKRKQEPSASSSGAPAVRSVFGKNGLPIHPERSLYYDPVMNPYGMPPPGMPYAERPLLPHEIEEDQRQLQAASKDMDADEDAEMSDGSEESDSDETGSDDEDIALPAGPPPDGANAKDTDSSSEDSDDIPMPAGPPPPKSAPPLPMGVPPPVSMPPFPMGAPYPSHFSALPPTIATYAGAPSVPPPPVPPMGIQPGYSLPYPPQMPGTGGGPRPVRDRQHIEAARVVQDPLSNVPHVTFQAHQAQRSQIPSTPSQSPAGLPLKPTGTPHSAASATIFAEPELRDLKKEATAFVPTSMRRAGKKGATSNPSNRIQIDAAPGEQGDGPPPEARKDLMSTLDSQLGIANRSTAAPKPSQSTQGNDDYDKFMSEVGSFL